PDPSDEPAAAPANAAPPEDGALPTLEPGLLLVGRYQIVRELGHGGMGRVFEARDCKLGRSVAIKVIGAAWPTPGALRRFEQEARAVGSLNHPNVLVIFDIGEHRGRPFIVTELLTGEPLRARLSAGALPPEEAARIAAQIAEGLFAAHKNGLVHRDLKPENVFLGKDGWAKVLDFGIAKLVETERAGTLSDAPDAEAAASLS